MSTSSSAAAAANLATKVRTISAARLDKDEEPSAKRAKSTTTSTAAAAVVSSVAVASSACIPAGVATDNRFASSEKFFCTQSTLKATLERYGVAVIPSVLDANQVAAMQAGAWSMLEHIGAHTEVPLKQANPASWRSFRELLPMHNMLMQHHGVGHAQFIWDIRQNPKVVDTFAELWQCSRNDLLVSFDGLSFHFPPETINVGYFRNSWYHTDQSPLRSAFECVQSWVTAYDVNEGDATLAVLVGSHKHHHQLRTMMDATELKAQGTSDWFKLDATRQQRFIAEFGCVEHFITCPSGSQVFWDSRTIHCGRESVRGRAQPNFRCVAYICMLPRHTVTKPSIFTRRRKAFDERRMTSHWPNQCKLFAKLPRVWDKNSKPLPQIDPLPKPILTALGRKLVA